MIATTSSPSFQLTGSSSRNALVVAAQTEAVTNALYEAESDHQLNIREFENTIEYMRVQHEVALLTANEKSVELEEFASELRDSLETIQASYNASIIANKADIAQTIARHEDEIVRINQDYQIEMQIEMQNRAEIEIELQNSLSLTQIELSNSQREKLVSSDLLTNSNTDLSNLTLQLEFVNQLLLANEESSRSMVTDFEEQICNFHTTNSIALQDLEAKNSDSLTELHRQQSEILVLQLDNVRLADSVELLNSRILGDEVRHSEVVRYLF